MVICKKCILTDKFPGVTFSEDEVCNYCKQETKTDNIETGQYMDEFNKVIENTRGKYEYDCLLCYSGGKDSTYTLNLLKKKYNLNVLAYVFDNGFLSDYALKNIKNVTEKLNVDTMIFSPDFGLLKKIFVQSLIRDENFSKAALKRASAVCTTCIGFIKFNSLKVAFEKNIPIVAFGWAPGQVGERSIINRFPFSFYFKMQQMYLSNIDGIDDEILNRYFITERSVKDNQEMPVNINPLLFHEYNMKKLKAVLNELDWHAPEDTDPNSTNCLLNSLGNLVHEKKHGYNPYISEIASQVRSGALDREKALCKIKSSVKKTSLDYCIKKLELEKEFSDLWGEIC